MHVARAHDDAIGRRALDREVPLADLAQPQRIVERQRMRHAGLVGAPARPPRRRRKSCARSPRRLFRPCALMPSSLVTRMRIIYSLLDLLDAAHVGRERVRHRDRAVGLLIGFHHRDQRAADRDAGAVERVHEARLAVLAAIARHSCAAPGIRRRPSRTRFRDTCSAPAARPRCRRSSARQSPCRRCRA